MEKRGESLQMRIKFIHTIIILRSSSRRFVTSLGFYGLMINVPNLQGDLYINFFISFLIEIPATPISWFLLQRYVLLLVNLIFTSILLSFLTMSEIPLPTNTQNRATNYLAIFNKFLFSFSCDVSTFLKR